MTWLDYIHRLIGPNGPEIQWWQMSIRGAVAFFFGLVLLRMFGRRAFGQLTPVDIIVAIMIGSNLSRAITGSAPFFPTLAATALLMVLYWALIQLTARVDFLSHWFKGQPISLARDGRLDSQAMRRVGVSTGDVEESARLSGMDRLDQLQTAILERSGKISIIKRKL